MFCEATAGKPHNKECRMVSVERGKHLPWWQDGDRVGSMAATIVCIGLAVAVAILLVTIVGFFCIKIWGSL